MSLQQVFDVEYPEMRAIRVVRIVQRNRRSPVGIIQLASYIFYQLWEGPEWGRGRLPSTIVQIIITACFSVFNHPAAAVNSRCKLALLITMITLLLMLQYQYLVSACVVTTRAFCSVTQHFFTRVSRCCALVDALRRKYRNS